MYQVIMIIHVLVAMTIIGLVLIQHGKGADIGASFGSGASTTVFGSAGTGSFLFKLTAALALTFFVTSLSLSFIVSSQYQKTTRALMPQPLTTQESSVPVPVDSKGAP